MNRAIDGIHLYAPRLELAPAPQLVTAQPGEIVPEARPFPEGHEPTAEQEWARHRWVEGMTEYIMAGAVPMHLRAVQPEDAARAGIGSWLLTAASRAGLALAYWLIRESKNEADEIAGRLFLTREVPEAPEAQLRLRFADRITCVSVVRRSVLPLTAYADEMWGVKRVAAQVALTEVDVQGGLEAAGFEPGNIEQVPELDAQRHGSGMVQWWIKDLVA